MNDTDHLLLDTDHLLLAAEIREFFALGGGGTFMKHLCIRAGMPEVAATGATSHEMREFLRGFIGAAHR